MGRLMSMSSSQTPLSHPSPATRDIAVDHRLTIAVHPTPIALNPTENCASGGHARRASRAIASS